MYKSISLICYLGFFIFFFLVFSLLFKINILHLMRINLYLLTFPAFLSLSSFHPFIFLLILHREENIDGCRGNQTLFLRGPPPFEASHRGPSSLARPYRHLDCHTQPEPFQANRPKHLFAKRVCLGR